MSRVGKQTIEIPNGVEVKVDGHHISVKGPKGNLEMDAIPVVSVSVDEVDGKKVINSTVKNPNDKDEKAFWGLTQSLVANMVKGVNEGYEKQLEVVGVGYKVSGSGKKITLNVGYSHPVDYDMPEGVEAKIEKNLITVSGIDKQQVGQVAAEIRKIRKPEPYKGKGIKYVDEVIRRKAGKAAKAAE